MRPVLAFFNRNISTSRRYLLHMASVTVYQCNKAMSSKRRSFKKKGGPPSKYVAKEFRQGKRVREILSGPSSIEEDLDQIRDPPPLQRIHGIADHEVPLEVGPVATGHTGETEFTTDEVLTHEKEPKSVQAKKELLRRWTNVRDVARETLIGLQFSTFDIHQCTMCSAEFELSARSHPDHNEEQLETVPLVRCPDCSLDFCERCFLEQHASLNSYKPFHMPQVWNKVQ